MIITVVGLGVVGGSYVKALKGKGYEVYGVDNNLDTLKRVKEEGYILEGYADGSEICQKSDLTIICLYPSLVLDFIKKTKFKSGSIVSDAVGVKSFFLEQAISIIDDDVEYISGHPMAGRESRGWDYADGEVFKGSNFIIIEHPSNKKTSIQFMQKFVEGLGFKSVKILSPYDHDEIISFTSQLPHTLAISLITSDSQKYDTGKYIGDSYRDLTRIADINEDLWPELFISNKKYILQSMNGFQERFDILKKAIESEDKALLREIFIEAGKRRRNLE